MAKKMLIDATHAEETRVVVVDGTKVEEFDFESENKRQLAGNIYLAKVTRVEPSLQAAFVDYGGNRHGFLAFSEIHPDYYQIPIADREALMAEEQALADAERSEDDGEGEKPTKVRRTRSRSRSRSGSETPKTGAAAPETAEAAGGPDRSIPGMDVVELSPDDGEEPGGLSDDVMPVEPSPSPEASAEPVPVAEDDATPVLAAASESEIMEPATDPSPAEDQVEDLQAAPAEAAAVPADETERAAETTDPDAALDGVADLDEGSDDNDGDRPSATMAAAAAGDHVITEEIETAEADTDIGSGDAESGTSVASDDDDDNLPASASTDESDDTDEETAAEDTASGEIEAVADDDSPEEIRTQQRPRPRRYKIQEVIKVRQIMLVQVVKEERGNKGAALTTYLSLAGRYCVLMPNTARGGGISRKITNVADRKKLKQIAGELDVPRGAGLIIRTAGAQRTKAEIKRDYEYLQRLWEQIRELTLKSVAPAKIYAEGDLIKRSIRDLYNRDIEEVLVEGETGYRTAKDFMKMIMPSHAKNVKHYVDPMPLFARYQVESYLSEMFNPVVKLKSGGYIVIGVTEALVAIDVN